MVQPRTYRIWMLVAEACCAVFLLAAMYQLAEKPGLPYTTPAAAAVSVDGAAVSSDDELDFVLAAHRPGDTVSVTAGDTAARVSLVRANGWLHIVITSIVSWMFFLPGVVVFFLRPGDPSARIFHHASLATSIAIAGTQTLAGVQPQALGGLLGLTFFAAYSFVPSFFFHFTFDFPGRVRASRYLPRLLYAVSLLFAAALSFTFIDAYAGTSVRAFGAAQDWEFAFKIFLVVTLLAGIMNILVSYRRTQAFSERQKLRWILFGLTLGTAPFIFLWILPSVVHVQVIPEALAIGALVLIPSSFAISIVRHRLMDIDLVINRSIVYAIVFGGIAVCYALLVAWAAGWFGAQTGISSMLMLTGYAAVIAFLAEPARKRIQKFVDTTFFRVRYNFREAQRKLFDKIKQAPAIQHLGNVIVEETFALIPVERIGFFLTSPPEYRQTLIAHRNFDILERRSFRLNINQLTTELQQPIGLPESVEPGAGIERGDAEMFHRWDIQLIFPMTSAGKIHGFIVLGGKKSGARFNAEDIDFVNAVALQAALAAERLTLQQEIILEQEERGRLAELNRMKSYFVSSVSHDLKTPLTSIKLFAEMLRTNQSVPQASAREYLEIIEGETQRLTHMIDNVLSFAKTENGSEDFRFAPLSVNEVVAKVLRSMEYQFKMEQCTVSTHLAGDLPCIRGDADAVTRTLINLLANAMKFSSEHKHISVTTSADCHHVSLSVRDCGNGIAADEVNNVFDPFFRGKGESAGGAGLGLSIVKRIMDAHSGVINVESKIGEGSTFTLAFPVLERGQV